MGLYNYWLDKLPEPLSNSLCAICDSPIRPINDNPGLDAFQYCCKNCNPRVIIEISGSLLADNLYMKLREDEAYRLQLKEAIGSYPHKRFPLTTLLLTEHFNEQ